MLKERASFSQGFLRPVDPAMISPASGGMGPPPAAAPPVKPFTPTVGFSDASNYFDNVEPVTPILMEDNKGFRIGHTLEESVRTPIDESVLRKVLSGKLAMKKRSVGRT